MLFLIGTYIIWIIYIFLEGIREANCKHFKCTSNSQVEVKSTAIYYFQRILVLIILSSHLIYQVNPIFTLLSLISCLLIFPYIHSATYFTFRNKLDPEIFPYKACQNTKDISNRPSVYLEAKLRTNLALISIIIQICICFIQK